MRVIRHGDARSFLERASDWLLQREAEHNTILGDAHLLQTKEHPFKPPFYLTTIEHEGRIVGCATRPPPDGVTLTEMPGRAIHLLVEDIGSIYEALPGLVGPEREATEFAQRWADAHRRRWSVNVRWRWYKLETVSRLPGSPSGSLRLASSDDLALARAWAYSYAHDIGTTVDVPAFFERRIRTRSLYLWVDGTPRAIVAVSGVTPTSARVSAVYTPSEHRRQGYATAAVAAVSRAVLASGRKLCVLFADCSDPTANQIYKRIGYGEVCDVVGIRFF